MRTTELERVRYVQVFRRSGLTPVEFCSEHGLNAKTFYAWRRRYAHLDVLTGAGSFLPVHIKDGEVPSVGISKPPMLLTFKTKNFCLEVSIDAHTTVLILSS